MTLEYHKTYYQERKEEFKERAKRRNATPENKELRRKKYAFTKAVLENYRAGVFVVAEGKELVCEIPNER